MKKHNEESYVTQSKARQNALVQSEAFEQEIFIMGDTFEDLDIEIDQNDIEIEFLAKETRLPDSEVIKEITKLGLNKISSKRKGDRNMDRIFNSLKTDKHMRNKKQEF